MLNLALDQPITLKTLKFIPTMFQTEFYLRMFDIKNTLGPMSVKIWFCFRFIYVLIVIYSQIINILRIAVFQLKPTDPFNTAKNSWWGKTKKTSIEGLRLKITDLNTYFPLRKMGPKLLAETESTSKACWFVS